MDEMQQYIGSKIILAKPMNRKDYNDYRGWVLPENENPEDEGFLVEYTNSPNANHENHVVPWVASQTDILANDWMII